jgi:rod shape determining protein RodA
MERREIWKHFDYWLFGTVVLLCTFGVAMVRSAIAGNQILSGLVSRQMIFIGISLGVIILTAMVDYHYWFSLSRLMYGFAVASLLVIFVYGTAKFGSARWLDTGLILIQPSELAKIIMIIVLAAYFASQRDAPKDLMWILKGFGITFGVTIWILLQPNLSTSIVMFVMWFAMMWVGGLPAKYLAIFGLLALLGVALFLVLVFFVGVDKIPFVEGYQVQRVVNFLFPDPNARHGETYNVDQALITIGSGGWFGMGYGQGSQVQLRYLKVRHTDFIFAAMAEEFGFVGTVLIVSLIIFVIFRCFRAAKLASDPFGSLIAYGFGFLIFFQTAVNIGVNLKVIPVTGLTLPFVSYGGSSLLSLALGIGLVESVILRHKPYEF